MRKRYPVCMWFIAAFALVACNKTVSSENKRKQLLQLVQTIPMPNVNGRLDHMDVDVTGNRLFVAGLENGTLEVMDLKTGKRIHSIPGFKKPQGALYVEELNKLFVASGDDAMLRVFKGDTLEILDSIRLEPDPNRVVYEPHTKLFMWDTGERMQVRITEKLGLSMQRRANISGTSRSRLVLQNCC